MVRTCLPFIRSGQNHVARHSKRGEEDKADRRRGGKLEDNIRKGTGLEFGRSQMAVEMVRPKFLAALEKRLTMLVS